MRKQVPRRESSRGQEALLTRAGTLEAVTLAGSNYVRTRPGSDGADARKVRSVTRTSSGVSRPTHLPLPGSGPQLPTSRVNRRMDSMFKRRNFSQQCAKKASHRITSRGIPFTEFEMGRIFKYFI